MAYTTIDDPSVYFQIALYTGNGNTGKNIPLSSANFTGEYVGQIYNQIGFGLNKEVPQQTMVCLIHQEVLQKI